MTIAVIIAKKDGFFIVGDTLMQISNDSYKLNNQKVFFSEKQKVAMCIAGDAILVRDSGEHSKEFSLFTSFVVREFFNFINRLEDIISIEQISIILDGFIENNFPGYLNSFKNGVEYFYGGFFKQQGQAPVTTIYAHSGKPVDIYLASPEEIDNPVLRESLLKEGKILLYKINNHFLVDYIYKVDNKRETIQLDTDHFEKHVGLLTDLESLKVSTSDVLNLDINKLIYKSMCEIVDKKRGVIRIMGDERTFFNGNGVPYFTNYTQKFEECLHHMEATVFKTNLDNPDFHKHLLETVIPHLCMHINNIHPNSIGKHLHTIEVFNLETKQSLNNNFEYSSIDGKMNLTQKECPEYSKCSSLAESERKEIVSDKLLVLYNQKKNNNNPNVIITPEDVQEIKKIMPECKIQ